MRKKIVIFSSYGGGGHTAVANALTGYLNNEYEIVVSNMFTDTLLSLELLRRISKGRYGAEDIYNFLIARKCYRLLNLYYKVGSWYFKWRQKRVCQEIEKFLQQHSPDLIISVMPIVNDSILATSQKLNIPFLLIPTDLDISSFITRINTPSYERFKIALAFEDHAIIEKITTAHIPLNSCITTGFVLRPDFFEHKDLSLIKHTYHVPEKKPTILLLLGAVGSHAIYSFVQQLLLISHPCHLLICIGKQTHLQEKIETLPFPAHISYTVIHFTDRISDIMAIADVLITKSGSVSVNEALYMNLPMLLDATSPLLTWEQYNHSFIVEHNFGNIIHDVDTLPAIITHLLLHPQLLQTYKRNIINFNKKHGGLQVQQIIHEILNT